MPADSDLSPLKALRGLFASLRSGLRTLEKEQVKSRIELLCRWIGVPKSEVFPKTEVFSLSEEETFFEETFPSGAAFVREDGYVVPGTVSPEMAKGLGISGNSVRVRLPDAAKSLRDSWPEAKAVFLDWASQSASWEDLFTLWEDWERKGEVLASGLVQLPFEFWRRWPFGFYILFRHEAPASILLTSPLLEEGPPSVLEEDDSASIESSPNSFLEKAQNLRKGEKPSKPRRSSMEVRNMVSVGDLPMIPFTLESVNNPNHVWPTGVDGLIDKTL